MIETIKNDFLNVQDEICRELCKVSSQNFIEDNWKYDKGSGGGRTRVFDGADGDTIGVIEKGGVNFSAVEGKMNQKIAVRMGVPPESDFRATGVSLVIHPYNPFAPTVHLNVRYFEVADRWWFGGGVDLTPCYIIKEDCVHFHQCLKDTCDQFDTTYYPKYKKECDEYFYLKHRKETRGVGGIFFDYKSDNKEDDLNFARSVGLTFSKAYTHGILAKRHATAFSKEQRDFQLVRRGRYVEFNLIYDRGTLFGLETEGRTESILMSLPATACWKYNYKPEPGTPESDLTNYLKPVDWLNIEN